MTSYSALGHAILALLEERAMSRADLVCRTGLKKETLNDAIAGRRRVRAHTRKTLAIGLGVTPEDLARREREFQTSGPGTDIERANAVQADVLAMRALLDGISGERSRSARVEIIDRSTPRPPPDFVGRELERKSVVDDLRSGRVGLISAVRGMGGIGKTTLALVVGRDVAGDFPDGQVWVDLKGSRPGSAISSFEAMGRVIHQIDLLADLARDIDARAAQFRSSLAGRCLLLVLDDARDAAQVAPLVPPAPSTLLITSRRSFVLPGLRAVVLPLLSPSEAQSLVLAIVGGSGREIGASDVDRIVNSCGRLPLAVRAAASFLSENRDWSVEDFLARLGAERTRLDALKTDDPELDVRAVLGFSFAQLHADDPGLASRWADLSIIPSFFDVTAAAAVWNCAVEEAKSSLSALVRRTMLEFNEVRQRYGFHDLMRMIAEEVRRMP